MPHFLQVLTITKLSTMPYFQMLLELVREAGNTSHHFTFQQPSAKSIQPGSIEGESTVASNMWPGHAAA
jgi:hypothetical protein